MGRLICTVLVLAALALPSAAAGAQKGIETDMTWGTSAATQARTAGLVHELGAGWVRLTFSWHNAEPRRGQYSRSYLGRVNNAILLLKAEGVHVLLDVGESPAWETGSSDQNTPPAHDTDFATFL